MKPDFTERTVESKSWGRIHGYSDFSFAGLLYLPHLSAIYVGIDYTIHLVSRLKILPSSHYRTSGLPTIGHRWVFSILDYDLSVYSMSESKIQTVFMILFITNLLSFISIFYLLYLNKTENQRSEWSKSVYRFATTLSLLLNSIFLVWTMEAVMKNIISGDVVFRILALIQMISIPIGLSIHNLLSNDYRFDRKNLLQGRDYSYFFFRVFGMWAVSIVRYTFVMSRNQGNDLFVSFANLGYAILLISIHRTQNTFYSNPSLDRATSLIDIIHAWESLSNIILTIDPVKMEFFDYDYMFIVVVPLGYWVNRNLVHNKEREIIMEASHLKQKNSYNGAFFLDLLYYRFCNQKVEQNHFDIYTIMSMHTQSCKDPYCLCFVLKDNIDLAHGEDAGKAARRMMDAIKDNSDIATARAKLTTIDELSVLNILRSHHSEVAKIDTTDSDFSSASVNKEASSNASKQVGSTLNLNNPLRYTLAFCSFYRAVMKKFNLQNSFEAVFAYIRFMIYEFENPLAALFYTYEFVYSEHYKKESRIDKHLMLQNCIRISTRLVRENTQHFNKVHNIESISHILYFRKRVEKVTRDVWEVIDGKHQMYSEMMKKRVNFKALTDLGGSLFKVNKRVKKDISELLKQNHDNKALLRAAIRYELYGLEVHQPTKDILRKLKDQLTLEKVREGSMGSIDLRQHTRVSPYSSDHVGIFCRLNGGRFTISHFTENGLDYFEPLSGTLTNMSLSSFMPHAIGQVHDMLMLAYMNGESESKLGGKIKTILVSNVGECHNVIVLPRLEVLLTNEVYIAGLMMIKKNSKRTMFVTDDAGRISAASTELQERCEMRDDMRHESIFSMIPSLYPLYFPDSDISKGTTLISLEVNPYKRTEYHSLMIYPHSIWAEGIKLPPSQLQNGFTMDLDVECVLPKTASDIAANDMLQIQMEIRNNKTSLIKSISRILVFNVLIKSYSYQRGIKVKVVEVISVYPLSTKIGKIIRHLAQNSKSILEEIVMLSIDTIRGLVRAAEIHTIVENSRINSQAGSIQEINPFEMQKEMKRLPNRQTSIAISKFSKSKKDEIDAGSLAKIYSKLTNFVSGPQSSILGRTREMKDSMGMSVKESYNEIISVEEEPEPNQSEEDKVEHRRISADYRNIKWQYSNFLIQTMLSIKAEGRSSSETSVMDPEVMLALKKISVSDKLQSLMEGRDDFLHDDEGIQKKTSLDKRAGSSYESLEPWERANWLENWEKANAGAEDASLLASTRSSVTTFKYESMLLRQKIGFKLKLVKYELFSLLLILLTVMLLSIKITTEVIATESSKQLIVSNDISSELIDILLPLGYIFKETTRALLLDKVTNITGTTGWSFPLQEERLKYTTNSMIKDALEAKILYTSYSKDLTAYSNLKRDGNIQMSVFSSLIGLISKLDSIRSLSQVTGTASLTSPQVGLAQDLRSTSKQLYSEIFELYITNELMRIEQIKSKDAVFWTNLIFSILVFILVISVVIISQIRNRNRLVSLAKNMVLIDKRLFKEASDRVHFDKDNSHMESVVEVGLATPSAIQKTHSSIGKKGLIFKRRRQIMTNRELKPRYRSKKNGFGSHSFTHMPEKSIKWSVFTTTVVMLLTFLLSTYTNIILRPEYLSQIEGALKAASYFRHTIVSSNYMLGVYYGILLDKVKDNSLTTIAPETITQQLSQYLGEKNSITTQQTIITTGTDVFTCHSLQTFMPSSILTKCTEYMPRHEDATVLESFNQFLYLFNLNYLDAKSLQMNAQTVKQLLQEGNIQRFDLLGFYLTNSIMIYKEQQVEKIQQFLAKSTPVLLALNCIYCIVCIAFLILFRLYVLGNSNIVWTNFLCTILMMNNEILSSPYLVSYFSSSKNTWISRYLDWV